MGPQHTAHSLSQIIGGNVEKDTTDADGKAKPRQEVLKPGALYAECAVVPLEVTVPDEWIEQDAQNAKNAKAKAEKEKGKGKAKSTAPEETLALADDGEYGGERAGRAVWEAFEATLKVWEACEEKEKPAAEGDQRTAAPSS